MPCLQQQVINIGAVVPLAVLYIYLAPYELFGRHKTYGQTKEITLLCVSKPGVIDATDSIDRIKNNIDKIVVFKYFGYPPGVRQFNTVTVIRKTLKQLGILVRLAEDIQIFRIPLYTGMERQSDPPADHEIARSVHQ